MAAQEVVERASARKTFTCENCGEAFSRFLSHLGKTGHSRYCSRACASAAKPTVTCDGCGAKVRVKPTHQRVTGKSSTFYCSAECRRRANSIDLCCEGCGKPFTRFRSQISRPTRGRFCSRECKEKHGREVVRCSWPGCEATLWARPFNMKRGVHWKVEFTKTGRVVKHPFCDHHETLAARFLPSNHRLHNGNQKWFSDPGIDLGTRGVSGVVTRLMIWTKTRGCCADCGEALDFDESPRRWNIDHKIPVFKGGMTNYWNLEALCADCHGKKSAAEKSEANKIRHREHSARRWLTHPEKDAVIAKLQKEVDALRARLKQKESGHAPEGLGRRVPVPSQGLREVRRRANQGGQGDLFVGL